MLATLINSLAICLGAFVGLVWKKHIKPGLREIIFVSAGIVSLTIGLQMALTMERILYLALSIVGGGIVGTLLKLEDRILSLGEALKKLGRIWGRPQKSESADLDSGSSASGSEQGTTFAQGFLEASVLFCAGAMAILGSIQAGTKGDFALLLTKSVLDGFISILMAASLGAGVIFSALSVFLYQGTITLLASVLQSSISPLMLTMMSSVGGLMVIMIGINLLGLKKIPTGNFLPALVFALLFALADPAFPAFLRM